jgi:hypothetical protein
MDFNKHLHIVSFDIPFPPSYGGVIDVYFKIKALHQKGIKVHLHCFEYGRKPSKTLEKICHKVNYYPRNLFMNPFNGSKPYIVKTRKSDRLLEVLKKDNYPILFEGVHTTYYLDHPSLENRIKIVRMHNIEHLYYKNLAKVEKNPLKKLYFNNESNNLKDFQKKLKSADYIASISPADHQFLQLKYGNSFYLPVFHPNEKLTNKPGKSDFILYHGNLGVGENNEAAIYLVKEIFPNVKIKSYIAGSSPSKNLYKTVNGSKSIKIFPDPELNSIYNMIENAHINVLPTFQGTGIKLKLINVLFRGRFCVVNSTMVKDTGLEDLCYISDDKEEMVSNIHQLLNKEFTEKQLHNRQEILEEKFNNYKNIDYLIEKIS